MKERIFLALATSAFITLPVTVFASTPSQQTQTANSALPVLIDGVKYSPSSPSVKNVKYFVDDDSSQAKGVVYGFTSNETAQFQSEINKAKTARAQTNAVTPQLGAYSSVFYRDSNRQGVSFATYNPISSLVPSGWNDQISSFYAGWSHTWTILCWDTNYNGSEYWTESQIVVESLVPYGWNDQASSITFSN